MGQPNRQNINLIMRAGKVLDWGDLVKTWQQLSWRNCCEISGFHHTALRPSDFWVVTVRNSLQVQRPRTLKLLHLGGGFSSMYCCKCTCAHDKEVLQGSCQISCELQAQFYQTPKQKLMHILSHKIIILSLSMEHNTKYKKCLDRALPAARCCTRWCTLPICTAQDSFHIFWTANATTQATTSKWQLQVLCMSLHRKLTDGSVEFIHNNHKVCTENKKTASFM